MGYLEKYSDEELFNIFGSDIEKEIKNRGYEYGWYKPTQYAGEIYILVNPAFANLVKIGYADNVEKRVKSLNSNSGLPDPYHVYATYKVKKRLEDLKLHELIDSLDSDLRHAKNREFYDMSPEKAYNILSAIAQINGDEELLKKNPLNDDFFLSQETDTIIAKPTQHQTPSNTGKTEKTSIIPDGIYYFKKKVKRWDGNFVEGALRVDGGRLILQKGSICCPKRGNGWTKASPVDKFRNGRFVVNNVLQEDVEFTSVSTAAAMLTWSPEDGWQVWKTEDGKPIDIFRNTKKSVV